MNELKQIESALNIAANKGCFNLQDSAILFTALKKIESELSGVENKQAASIPGGGIKKPKP